jgi:hypothetical protein
VWDNTGIHETVEGLDVVWIPLRIDSSIGTGLQIEHRRPDVRVFANAGFSFAVKVPDGLSQSFGNIRAFFLQCVPNMVGGDYVRLTPFKSSSDAEQSNDIRVICMEKLPSCNEPVDLEKWEIFT